MPIKLDLSKKNQREKIITENFDNVTWNDVKNVKEIIFLADISKTEIHDFKVFSDIVFDEEKMEQNKKEIKRSVVILTSLDKASIKNAWDQRIEVNKDFEEYQEDIKKENIKDYFDFNFNINSMGILGATLKLSGVDQNKFFLSKYTLQFLYKLQEIDKPRTEGELISVMNKWKGTGKYENNVGLGTEVSRSEIISSICNSGLLHINGNQIVKTEKLDVLLANLHKDCKDLDLPFRIHNWKEEDCMSAFSKINTYIEKFFGKQKRRLEIFKK